MRARRNLTIIWCILLLRRNFFAQLPWQSTALFLINYGSERNNRLCQCTQFYYWINMCLTLSVRVSWNLPLCNFSTIASSSDVSRNKNKFKIHTMPHAQKLRDVLRVPLEASFPRLTLYSTLRYSVDTHLTPSQWALIFFILQQEETAIFIALGCRIDHKQTNSQLPLR